MISDMEANKTLSPIVPELYLGGGKLNISIVFISQSHLKVPKTIRLNATHHFIMKITNKSELRQPASNHSADIELKDFMNLYKDFKRPFSFIVNDETLSSNSSLRFRKNLYKMSITKKIKTINKKIDQNKAQYCLDRQTAKISA